MSMRILYDGPPLSGRRTSVSAVLRGAGLVLDPFVDTYALTLPYDGAMHELEIEILLRRDNHPVGVGPIEELPDAHGCVFMVDSHPARQSATRDRWRRLENQVGALPVVFQVNKRDLIDAVSMSSVMADLTSPRCGYVESIASSEIGTTEAITKLIGLVLSSPC